MSNYEILAIRSHKKQRPKCRRVYERPLGSLFPDFRSRIATPDVSDGFRAAHSTFLSPDRNIRFDARPNNLAPEVAATHVRVVNCVSSEILVAAASRASRFHHFKRGSEETSERWGLGLLPPHDPSRWLLRFMAPRSKVIPVFRMLHSIAPE